MGSNPFSSQVGGKVLVAFIGDDSVWRTLGGIARESGLTTSEVTDFINENSDYFVQSSVKPGGRALYGIRDDLREVAVARPVARLAKHAAG